MIDYYFGQFALYSSLAVDVIVAFSLVVLYLSGKSLPFKDRVYTTFVVLTVIGLLGQAIRSYVAISTGIAPTDGELSFWIFKDFALATWAIHLMMIIIGKVKVRDIEFDKCNDAEHIQLISLRDKERKLRKEGKYKEEALIASEIDELLIEHSYKTSNK